jgi:hypothetical protein
MWSPVQAIRAHRLGAILVFCLLGFLAPFPGIAQTPEGVVPITSEPEHKIRFDNGKVRMVEVVLPKGKASLFHEHRADAFFVFFRTAEITSEPLGGKPVATTTPAGSVHFRSTADGPYVHRVIATGEETVHVVALELLAPAAPGPASASQERFPPFEVALENSRGRLYRLKLGSGESTEAFTRPAGTAIFAVSSGRIREKPEGKPARLWDFEPGHFRWVETGEALSLRNEGSAPIEWVEIEVF